MEFYKSENYQLSEEEAGQKPQHRHTCSRKAYQKIGDQGFGGFTHTVSGIDIIKHPYKGIDDRENGVREHYPFQLFYYQGLKRLLALSRYEDQHTAYDKKKRHMKCHDVLPYEQGDILYMSHYDKYDADALGDIKILFPLLHMVIVSRNNV